jgi:alpha-glucosidase
MTNRFLIFLIFLNLQAFAQWQVTSPNGKVRANIQRADDGKISYSVDYIDNFVPTVIIKSSPLGITRNDQDFTSNLTNETATNEIIDDHYTMLTGKQSSLWNYANQLTLSFKNTNNAKLQIIFRAYDDGVAFRYIFPENTKQLVNITGENTGFSLPTGGKGWLSKNTSPANYEQYYTETAIGNAAPDGFGWNFPALFQSNNFWYLLSESGLDENFYAAHLSPTASNGLYKIQLPDQADGNNYNAFATASLPLTMPWRTIILGKNLSDIVESSLINHLAEPSKISNTTWIKPGLSSWSWWSDFSSPKDYAKLKEYVDFSKTQGLPYTLVDANWNIMTGGDLPQLAQYAQNQGVGLWIWYNSGGTHNSVTDQPRNLMNDTATRQAEFLKLKNMGIKGIKIDFFQSDKQPLIKLYFDILKDAAANNLMVNFHGCTIPRGWQRTYPNLVALEAVMGAEQLLFNQDFKLNSPAHNVNLVFTRNVVGSMDYTPAIIGIERVTHNTTTAHELALLALFESGVIHLADKVANYQALNPSVLKIITQIPTTWDETHLLQGEPNKYAFLARRKGDNWYVSGINGENIARTVHFNIPFLDLGNYAKQIIADGKDARSLDFAETNYVIGKEETISLLPYGGFLIVLKKIPCNLLKPIITKTEISQISLSVNSSSTNIQWLLNRVEISGATAATYLPKQVGNYAVRITDNTCTAVSDEVSVIITKPTIAIIGKNPSCAGDSIKLQVSPTYDQLQWFLNNNDLKVNATTLTVKKAGVYKVVGNKSKLDSEPSDAVNLIFSPLPNKPNIILDAGTLKVVTTATVQWIYNGLEILGAKNTAYTPTKEGNYTVKITENGCSNTSDNLNFRLDIPTISITGKNPACEGDSVTITASTGYDKYKWFLGNDSLIINKSSFSTKKSGVYKVIGTKGNTQKTSDTVTVMFNAYPQKPTIYLSQNSLLSSSLLGNQWFENGTILAGEINQQLSKFASKIYVVKVTQNGCTTSSDPFVITSLSSIYERNLLKIYPNPSDGKVKVDYVSAQNITILVTDLNGKLLAEKFIKDQSGSSEIDLTGYISGIYLLKISCEKWSVAGKILIK